MGTVPLKPERPQKPVPNASGKAGRSLMTILLAGVAGLFLAGTFAMVFLAALGPLGIAIIAIGVVIFVVAGLQYLVWGWWLGPAIRREAEAERRRIESDTHAEDGHVEDGHIEHIELE